MSPDRDIPRERAEMGLEPDVDLSILDPLAGRQRVLVLYLRVALAVVLVSALIALAVPEPQRPTAGVLMVLCLIVVPLSRVAWLAVRWARRGDWRFAAVAVGLLAIVACGLMVR